jgi:hypothetical protein
MVGIRDNLDLVLTNRDSLVFIDKMLFSSFATSSKWLVFKKTA